MICAENVVKMQVFRIPCASHIEQIGVRSVRCTRNLVNICVSALWAQESPATTPCSLIIRTMNIDIVLSILVPQIYRNPGGTPGRPEPHACERPSACGLRRLFPEQSRHAFSHSKSNTAAGTSTLWRQNLTALPPSLCSGGEGRPLARKLRWRAAARVPGPLAHKSQVAVAARAQSRP